MPRYDLWCRIGSRIALDQLSQQGARLPLPAPSAAPASEFDRPIMQWIEDGRQAKGEVATDRATLG